MIDLLPTEGKKIVAREKVWSFLIVFLLVATGVCLLATMLALPTRLLLSRYEASLSDLGGLADEVQQRKADVEKNLKMTRDIIEHISKATTTLGHSTLIADLDRLAGEEVRLTNFNFDSKKKLVLSGVAVDRLSLSTFRDQLSGYDAFKSVELPLSNLVKDTEVPFSMTITLR